VPSPRRHPWPLACRGAIVFASRMELAGKNGDKFELTVIRYQFPNSSRNDWDANWLIIRTRAAITGHEWSSDDPSMLTWEVEDLANWLESLSNNREVNPLLDFVEPNLSFQLVDRSSETTRLQVCLQLESRLPWKSWSGPGESPQGPILDCSSLDWSSNELFAWSTNLKEQLRKFPRRAPLPNVSKTVSPTTNDDFPNT
jgi:hypothetical protein